MNGPLEEAVVACADLVGRTGAKDFQIGYLHDGVPADQAGWYAHARYRGARVTVEDQPGPAEACDLLAARLLEGGTCVHCGKKTTVRILGRDGCCRWRRAGARWERGCA